MLAYALADAGVVRFEHRAAVRHRDAARALAMGHRPFIEGSLLHFAPADGSFHVSRFEDDAHDGNGPATAGHDENHAHHHGGHLHDFTDFQRPGSVYSHQQRGRYRPAVVLEQEASCARAGKARAREEVLIRSFREARRLAAFERPMAQELIHDGKLDRQAAAEALRLFLENMVRVSGLELKVNVRSLPVESAVSGSDAEVLADLDGKDKEILLERGAEVLKAFEYLAFRALRLEPTYHEKIHIDSGGYRALRFEELRMTARVAAERVQSSRQPFRLNPMSSRERRIVHMALKDMNGIRTESVGVGEERQVVIHPADGKPSR
jgi:spoIIIJ-associated protein